MFTTQNLDREPVERMVSRIQAQLARLNLTDPRSIAAETWFHHGFSLRNPYAAATLGH